MFIMNLNSFLTIDDIFLIKWNEYRICLWINLNTQLFIEQNGYLGNCG